MGNQITNTITEILSDEPYVPSEVPTQNQLNVLRELQKQLASKPAPDCQEDIALFRDLWEAAGGESGEFVLESDFWKDRFGFQSQKPLSDVRGGGRLSLLALQYLSKNPRGRQLLDKAQRRRDAAVTADLASRNDEFQSYPFAPALINVVRMIAERLQVVGPHGLPAPPLETSSSPNYHSIRNIEDFYDIVVDVMYLVDQQFERVGAGYMGFPEVMKSVDESLNSLLRQRAANSLRLVC
ncbi:hypothetical protein TrCOL_g9763 [Triparma columacea]|uniref:ELMO domain-containing protein n=1 Tax=Triparma columacea TaxID=722753 RepID=A0A9W7GEE4_9STRA|nr:hypothetical protein TrCOL_g9763 [Triparma columacea]